MNIKSIYIMLGASALILIFFIGIYKYRETNFKNLGAPIMH